MILLLCRRFVHDDSGGLVLVLNETVCILNECKGLTVSMFYHQHSILHGVEFKTKV